MYYWNDDWSVGEWVEYFDPEKFRHDLCRIGTGQPAKIIEIQPRNRYSKLRYIVIGLIRPNGEVGKNITVSDEHIKLRGQGEIVDVDNEHSLDAGDKYSYKNTEEFAAIKSGDIIYFKHPSKKDGLFEANRKYRCIESTEEYIIIRVEETRIKITYKPFIKEETL